MHYKRLKELRKKQELTQQKLADYLHVNQKHILDMNVVNTK